MQYADHADAQRRALALGYTIKKSDRGKSRYDLFKGSKYIQSIGHKDYKNFHIYKIEKGKKYADNRRRLYYARHKNTIEKSIKDNNLTSAAYLAWKILWS
jgi:hypothetical protein